MSEIPAEQKKMPYNIREKQNKEAVYRKKINSKLADKLEKGVYKLVVSKRNYRNPDYSAKELAKDLSTNTRYLSAVINDRFGMNFSSLLNRYRVRDALKLLAEKRYSKLNVADISVMVGFANRQSFYAAFYRLVGMTPRVYKMRKLMEAKKESENETE
ncbi:MAG: helix-turn-helix domain-containing protein [Bacteroidales bacterium]|nr:helix-turn-helix domain-containing protein [Bacteroidales bacterium]